MRLVLRSKIVFHIGRDIIYFETEIYFMCHQGGLLRHHYHHHDNHQRSSCKGPSVRPGRARGITRVIETCLSLPGAIIKSLIDRMEEKYEEHGLCDCPSLWNFALREAIVRKIKDLLWNHLKNKMEIEPCDIWRINTPWQCDDNLSP